jgi:hypothetical protein
MKRRRLIALAAVLPWSAFVLLRWGVRSDLSEQASMVVGQTIFFGALLGFACLVAISSGRRGLGGPVSRARMVALGAPIVFMVVGLLWLPAGAPGAFGEVGPVARLWPCLLIGVLVAVPILMAALWAVRRAFPSAVGWRGAALGAAAGLAGAIVLAIVIGALLGGLLGPKVARA